MKITYFHTIFFITLALTDLTLPAGNIDSGSGYMKSGNTFSFVRISSGFSKLPNTQTLLGIQSSFLNSDSDGDGNSNILEFDNDNDGLADTDELFTYLTDHNNPDSDDDTIRDRYEVENNLDPFTDDRNGDKDGDGFSNQQEFERGTNSSNYKIVLIKGWNLVSIAGMPTDNTISGIFENKIRSRVWYWDEDRFRSANELQQFRAYWVYSPFEDESKNLAELSSPTPVNSFTINLHLGWNLISIPRMPNINSVESILKKFNSEPVWNWDGLKLRSVTEIEPLKGYWVYAREPASITVNLP